jgi:hypothetical protein
LKRKSSAAPPLPDQTIRSATSASLDIGHYKPGDAAAARHAIEKRELQGMPVPIPSPIN